jgi:hypothetical protein
MFVNKQNREFLEMIEQISFCSSFLSLGKQSVLALAAEA